MVAVLVGRDCGEVGGEVGVVVVVLCSRCWRWRWWYTSWC